METFKVIYNRAPFSSVLHVRIDNTLESNTDHLPLHLIKGLKPEEVINDEKKDQDCPLNEDIEK